MQMNKKEIVESLRKTQNKKKYTFALSPTAVEPFQKECDRLGLDYGPTVEKLMNSFVIEDETVEKKKKS
jgi:hypothetical protein